MSIFDVLVGDDGIYEALYKELLKKRIIYFNQVVDDSTVDLITLPIILKNIEEENVSEDKLEPITIYLNTDGGDVISANHLIEVIKTSRIPVHCKVLAKACSAGLLITLACKYRMASKESVLLMHDGEFMLANSSSKAKDTMEFLDVLEAKIDDLVLTRSKLDKDEYEKLKRKELYVFGEEALKLGFIDALV